MRAIFIRHGESTGNAGVPCHDLATIGLSALLGHGYTVDNRAQPEMATFGVFRRRVPPIAMQNRRLPLDHWGQVVVRSDFR